MHPIPRLIVTLISIYFMVIIVFVIAFWLRHFSVIDVTEPTTGKVYTGLEMLTDPVLDPIRALLPNLGGLDISPALALVGLWFIQALIHHYAGRRPQAGRPVQATRPVLQAARPRSQAHGDFENQPFEE